jgi:hypothetical protein
MDGKKPPDSPEGVKELVFPAYDRMDGRASEVLECAHLGHG